MGKRISAWVLLWMLSACGVKSPPLPPIVVDPAESEVRAIPESSPTPTERR